MFYYFHTLIRDKSFPFFDDRRASSSFEYCPNTRFMSMTTVWNIFFEDIAFIANKIVKVENLIKIE